MAGVQDGGPRGRFGQEVVGRLPWWFYGTLGGTLSAPWDQGPRPESSRGGTFEICYNYLCRGHILDTVAHNIAILGLRWWWVVNGVPWWREKSDITVECMVIATVKPDNHIQGSEDIYELVVQIDCLCLWQFMTNFLMNQNCLHGVVVCHIGHPKEPNILYSVEICWSIYYRFKSGSILH